MSTAFLSACVRGYALWQAKRMIAVTCWHPPPFTCRHGMCHAPFAPARSFLKEYGFGDVKVLVHDGATGPGFRVTSAAALLPGTAAWVPSCG